MAIITSPRSLHEKLLSQNGCEFMKIKCSKCKRQGYAHVVKTKGKHEFKKGLPVFISPKGSKHRQTCLKCMNKMFRHSYSYEDFVDFLEE